MHSAFAIGGGRRARLHVPTWPDRRGGAALVGIYLAIVAILAALPLDLGALASSPAGVARGQLWPLLASGLMVAGDPLLQLPALALAALLVVRRCGGRTFWRAALVGHVGATLVTYAGLGALWLLWRPDIDRGVLTAPDFGISCVWTAALGALLASAATGPEPRRIRPWLAPLACLGMFFAEIPVSFGLSGAEHLLALLFGASVVAVTRRRRRATCRLARRPEGAVGEAQHA